FGLQFHPEVTHTPEGGKVLSNFLLDVCECSGSWKLGDLAQELIEQTRKTVGSDRVICGLSGGVDSSVTAALLYQAIGDQMSCILVDHGLLRKNEQQDVIEAFTEHFHADLRVVQAQDQFLDALAGISDPQEKRRIIGHNFIECFRAEAETIEDAKYLAQGTLYPDVIESGAAPDGPAA
ncbi:MAG: GMP synthase (glutamine-hydrolyzing), partial [Planctomycetaceae bacterium]|nr:GMP synthase (glutamine-hydrolyzing) [Planctomycetaceae bacterium]